ncbi:MAG: hypothetical protein MN733_14265, partial [Nitrososphaera sp.]|nr:hypothetical protein [Nitrososphaera sp.]
TIDKQGVFMQRIITIAGSVLLMIFSIAGAYFYYVRAQDLQVEVNQMPADNGVIPVEIKNVKTQMSDPSELTELSFAVKNNSSKAITSIAATFGLITEKNGQLFVDHHFVTSDTQVHPDIREIHHFKPLAPGQEKYLDTPTNGYSDGRIIKGVTLNVDYIEFADNSTLGPNKMGGRIITLQREGARLYKNWLMRESAGKDLLSIVSSLKNPALPREMADTSMHLRQGANIYRRHLLGAYESGHENIEKFFNQ